MTTPEVRITPEFSAPQSDFDPAALLAAIIESSDDAIIGKSLDGTITSWNLGAERMYGYLANEVIGQNIAIITPADRLEELVDVLARIGRGERIEHHETKRVCKDGSVLDLSVTISPIRDATGTVVGASAIGRNITDRLALERVRFRALLTSAPDAIVGVDAHGRVEFASDRVEALFGWSPNELIGEMIEVLIPETAIGIHEAHRAHFVADPHPRQMGAELELTARRKDGTVFPAEISLSTITKETGELQILAAVRDVTTARRTERESKEREELFDQFARSTEVGFSLRESNQMLYMNPSFQRIFEIGQSRPFPTLLELETNLHPDDRAAATHAAVAADHGESSKTELRVVHSDDSIQWLTAANDRVTSTDGSVARVATTFTDITDRKIAEAVAQHAQVEAQDARVEAERANAAKTEFLSRMSHELRTPLNAILGFGQLLEMDEMSAERRDSVDHIIRAGGHLLELIDEVLDISQMERGEMRLFLEPVNVAEVSDEAVGMIRPLADRRRIHIVDDGLLHETFVHADRQRLKQVLVNLLANAVKYNRDGGLVRIESALVNAEQFRLTVSDTGVGIAEGDLGRLFQPFERLSSEQSHVEGTGLGLALTKQLMLAMNGTIGVASRLDEGSSFWVELSIAEGPTVDDPITPPFGTATAPRVSAETKTILFVEDNLSNVRLLERIVARQHHIVLMVAMQGRLAVEMAVEHQPDLILLDLHLPDISGEEVLHDLRADPRTADTPIVITSADATTGRPTQLLAQGATDYLTKPFDLQRLLGLINSLGTPPEPEVEGLEGASAREENASAPPVSPTDAGSTEATTDRSSELLRIVHTLNNELGVVLNFSALLAKGPLDRMGHSDLSTIRTAAERAIYMTKQLQDLALGESSPHTAEK